MTRPTRLLDGPAASARAVLPEGDVAAFERLASAVLASPTAPLGALLRAHLPGTAGVRWLHSENLPSTTRPTALTAGDWLSLFTCWSATRPAPGGGGGSSGRVRGRTSAHGHAPGAQAIPRWGS